MEAVISNLPGDEPGVAGRSLLPVGEWETTAARMERVAELWRVLAEQNHQVAVADAVARACCELFGFTRAVVTVTDGPDRCSYVAGAGLAPDEERWLPGRGVSVSSILAAYPLPAGHRNALWWSADGRRLVLVLTDARGRRQGHVELAGRAGLSADELSLLAVVADAASLALELVVARSSERAARAVAEAQRAQVDRMMAASRRLRGGLTFDDQLRETALAMTTASGFHSAAIFLHDTTSDRFVLRAAVGLSAEEEARLRAQPLSLDEWKPMMQPSMRLSQSYFFDHRHHSLAAEALHRRLLGHAGGGDQTRQATDALTVPLEGRDGSIIGIVSVNEPSHGLPDQAEVQTLEFFAHQCALAVDEHRRYQAVQVQALTDELTGLANRRALTTAARHAVRRARRDRSACSVLFVDIDHFKRINDQLGHAVGDLVLQAVGDALADRLRQGDLLARYGGEEFVIVLPDTDAPDATRLAEELLERVASLDAEALCQGLPIRVSIGVAGVSERYADLKAVLAAADAALYEAKRTGRNRVCVAESGPLEAG
jgi:diguanylate cyclase (GGDEF)-like protein